MNWCDIQDKQINLLIYFKNGSRRTKEFNIDEEYLRGKRIYDRKAISCLKDIYCEMMETIWGDHNSSQL